MIDLLLLLQKRYSSFCGEQKKPVSIKTKGFAYQNVYQTDSQVLVRDACHTFRVEFLIPIIHHVHSSIPSNFTASPRPSKERI